MGWKKRTRPRDNKINDIKERDRERVERRMSEEERRRAAVAERERENFLSYDGSPQPIIDPLTL